MDLKNIKYTSNDIIILYALKLILKRLEKNYNNDEEVDAMIKAIDEKLSWMGY